MIGKRRGAWMWRGLSALVAAFMLSGLSGCVTTQQQPDGSTKVKVSLADVLGAKPQPAVTMPVTAAVNTESKPITA